MTAEELGKAMAEDVLELFLPLKAEVAALRAEVEALRAEMFGKKKGRK